MAIPGEGAHRLLMTGQAWGENEVYPIRQFINKVVERGKKHELQQIKDLVLEAYREVNGREPSERLLRHFQTNDMETWKSAIGITVLQDGGGSEGILRLLQGKEAFQKFHDAWQRQPHYLNGNEVPYVLQSGVGRLGPLRAYWVQVQKALVESPQLFDFSGRMKELRGQTRSRKRGKVHFEIQRETEPSGDTLITLEVGDRHEFRIRFDGNGSHLGSVVIGLRGGGGPAEGAGEKDVAVSPPAARRSVSVRPAAELQSQILEGTRDTFRFGSLTRKMLRELSKAPDREGIAKFRHKFQKIGYHQLEVPLSDGSTGLIFNQGSVGVILRLDSQGVITSPVFFGDRFSPQTMKSWCQRMAQGEPWDPAVKKL